jgi:hypothetical protein
MIDVGAETPITPGRFSLHVERECTSALDQRSTRLMIGRATADFDTLFTAQVIVPEYQPGVALRFAGFTRDSLRFQEIREILGTLSLAKGKR